MSVSDTQLHIAGGSPAARYETLTVLSIILLVLTLGWSLVDPRMIDGVPVWMKPLKFSLSFVVVFATLALVERFMSDRFRGGRTMRLVGLAMAAAYLAEMAYIFYMAARGEHSHFNLTTPFHETIYALMGVGAVTLISGIAVIGWLAHRDTGAAFGPGLREGLWLGCLSTFVLTLLVAGYLSSSGGHFVGVHPEGGAVIPLVGWSGEAGDLRPAHFASMHAMQILPLLGLWLDRRDTRNAVGMVRLVAIGYCAATLLVFVQALLGLPLVSLG
jgi:hypothetical protein